MPTDTTPVALKVTKPSTRTSIRQSLNLSSMGKALADVMNQNKEARSAAAATEKARKGKDAAGSTTPNSRRSSAAGVPRSTTMTASRMSIGGARSSANKRDSMSDIQTVTQNSRRNSAILKSTAVDEMGVNASPSTTPPTSRVTRSASLRPRVSQTSALPKLRSKSTLLDMDKKAASPPRAGIRRRLSISDDNDDTVMIKANLSLQSPEDKSSRPISPLPHRASGNASLTATISIAPSTPDKAKRLKPKGSHSPSKVAARPSKAAKTSPDTFAKSTRPPSSSSSCISTPPTTPRTPKGPSSIRTALGFSRAGDTKPKSNSPVRNAVRSSPAVDSPFGKHARKNSTSRTPVFQKHTPSCSYPLGDSSEDSFELDDVEMLLAPKAALSAPTPAIPRFQPSRSRKPNPQSRAGGLPVRPHTSYQSPFPPTAEESPSYGGKSRSGYEKGSLMSWEQLARDSSRVMTEEEAETMITGLNLPFKAELGTPPFSPEVPSMHLEVPESPCLSALPSPGGYASLSNILLPEVTPSPAVQNENRYGNNPDIPAVDAAIVTLLRLQLASVENTAKERLYQLQSLEEQLHNSKELRQQQVDEMSQQITFLEHQLHGHVDAHEKSNEERATYTASLEDQLRHAEAYQAQAIEVAVATAVAQLRKSQEAAHAAEQRRWDLALCMQSAAAVWDHAHRMAEDELESVKMDKAMLAVLLAGLDQSQKQVCQSTA